MVCSLRCQLNNGSEFMEGEFHKLENESVPRSTDIVFIVEAKDCNKNILEKRNMASLLTVLSKELIAANIKENSEGKVMIRIPTRFSLVVFGGDGVLDLPRSIVVGNNVFSEVQQFLHYFENIPTGIKARLQPNAPACRTRNYAITSSILMMVERSRIRDGVMVEVWVGERRNLGHGEENLPLWVRIFDHLNAGNPAARGEKNERLVTTRSELTVMDQSNGNSDIFGALRFATNLLFRPAVAKTFILLPCTTCDPSNMTDFVNLDEILVVCGELIHAEILADFMNNINDSASPDEEGEQMELSKKPIPTSTDHELDYTVLHQVLLENDIKLHILMNEVFRVDKDRVNKMFYGIDSINAYTKKDFKNLKGSTELRRQVRLPKAHLGFCIPLAMESNAHV
uniref:Uncharacterized protein n=1 Tax=Timema monikensis TaxID=170555 RepID=A0A7R9HRD8_9NEOP|nr:unnamed protein product [Timema monikensis]